MDFNDLELSFFEERTSFAFIGILHDRGKLKLFLPKGFTRSNIDDNPKTKQDLFFLFYKILEQYSNICTLHEDRLRENPKLEGRDKIIVNNIKKDKASDRDGVNRNFDVERIERSGFNISQDGADKDIIFYSKIAFMDMLLSKYDELKILSLSSRIGKSECNDFNNIHKYLHQATFLKNGAAYISSIDTKRDYVGLISNDIVMMYCYIVTEVKDRLFQEVSIQVKALAEKFKEKYLKINCSLFDEKYYIILVNILRDALETIHKNTAIKEPDYWDFHEAIDNFLSDRYRNGVNGGDSWGNKNLWRVWESMCVNYIVKTWHSEVLYVDEQCLLLPELYASVTPTDPKNNRMSSEEIGNKRPEAICLLSYNYDKIKALCEAYIKESRGLRYEPKYNSDEADAWSDFGYRIQGGFTFKKLNKDDISKKKTENLDYFRSNIDMSSLMTEKPMLLALKKPLPEKYMTFWKIKSFSTSSKDYISELTAMYLLNHVFWLAFINGRWDFNEIIKKLNSSETKRSRFPSKESSFSFCDAFFRKDGHHTNIYSEKELEDQYQEFCQKIEDILNTTENKKAEIVKIIDAKYKIVRDYFDMETYKDSDEYYCKKKEHIEKHKNYSGFKIFNEQEDIDRQDKYRALVGEAIKAPKYERLVVKNPKIIREFWLPAYDRDDKKLEIEMSHDEKEKIKNSLFSRDKDNQIRNEDDRIDIKLINFNALAKEYFTS